MYTCPTPIFSNQRRSKIEGKSQHHDQHRTDERLLIAHLVEQASRLRTIKQIAQEEGEGDKRSQGVLGSGNLREEGYLQGALTLTVDGSKEAHYKIDECQEQEGPALLSVIDCFINYKISSSKTFMAPFALMSSTIFR